MTEEIKIQEFRIRYIGTETTDKETLSNTLCNNSYDDGGILFVDDVEPTIEKCSACNGLGNVDESMGFSCDCNSCEGRGWVEK